MSIDIDSANSIFESAIVAMSIVQIRTVWAVTSAYSAVIFIMQIQ